jgi:hypothetical protein
MIDWTRFGEMALVIRVKEFMLTRENPNPER